MTPLLRAKLNLINLARCYRACFCDEDGNLTPEGARVLRDLGYFGHLDRSTIKVGTVSGTVDPLATIAAEGRRDVVRRIWTHIKLDPATHPMMQQKDEYE